MKTSKNIYDLVIIGGGAAGFFCAIQCAERNPTMRILILEKSNKILAKVKISGGGRCNVTHACFDPREMVDYYPRGKKELLGPFHRFLCGDMMAWLADQGVETKIETDGRVFPISNNSQQIIDCFLDCCEKHKIDIHLERGATKLTPLDGKWKIETKTDPVLSHQVLFATGSSPAAWKLIASLGHQIVPPVPSLFTFNIKSNLIQDLPGVSVPTALVTIVNLPFEDVGPLLITHWGLSGPAILKLSAWAARELHDENYQFKIVVNWTKEELSTIKDAIRGMRQNHGKATVLSAPLFQLPKRLWHNMVKYINIQEKNFASLTAQDIDNLVHVIGSCELNVYGKSTFKEEFVTCGGVNTKEINFKTMESKINPGLFFAGEVINIDAITGGFNFQAAWTEAYIAAEAIVNKSQAYEVLQNNS